MFEEEYDYFEESSRVEGRNQSGGYQKEARFRARAYMLEKEMLSLGEEVRTTLNKGKSPIAAELRSVQKVLTETVKTIKSASTRCEPEKETTPPPPPPPGSQECKPWGNEQ